MAQAEAQVLLVGIFLDLVGGEGGPHLATLHQLDTQVFTDSAACGAKMTPERGREA